MNSTSCLGQKCLKAGGTLHSATQEGLVSAALRTRAISTREECHDLPGLLWVFMAVFSFSMCGPKHGASASLRAQG